MRAWMVATILRREWSETFRNRLLMSTILIPPVILTIAPLVLASVVGDRALPPELATQVLVQRPEWARFTAAEITAACVNACGKFPIRAPVPSSTSSERSPSGDDARSSTSSKSSSASS